MKKRMMLIINPMAGRSGYKTGFGEVMNILDSGGYLTTVYFTQGRGDATVFAAQHAAEYDTVACIGGDGTLSEVVSGLMQVPNPPPLGYIPMGTTNDVASTLGLPKNATDAALRIVTGTPTAFNMPLPENLLLIAIKSASSAAPAAYTHRGRLSLFLKNVP